MTTFVMEQDATFPPTGLEMSAWTPKSNKSFNARLFQERFELIKKWFEVWSKSQKWQLIEYVLLSLSDDDIVYLHSLINPLFPPPPPPPPPLPKEIREDFTRILPRFLSLKVFSYLDPRSLCRASQVSWHWHDLAQQNILWRPKCLKYNWFLPNQHQQPQQLMMATDPNTLWKRHYINCVQTMFWKPLDDKSSPLRHETPPSANDHEPSPSTTVPITSDTPTHSLPIETPTQPGHESKEPTQSNITRPIVIQQHPPWIHSSKFPQDLIKTSLIKENRENFHGLSRKRLRIKLFQQQRTASSSPHTDPDIHHNEVSSTYSDTDNNDHQLPSTADYEPLPTLNPTEGQPHQSASSPHRPPMLDPSLIERMRVHVPCSDQSITMSTINGSQERARYSIEESIEHIHQASPFPRLKPYYIEGDGESGEESSSRNCTTGAESGSSVASITQSIQQGDGISNGERTKPVDLDDSRLKLLHRTLTHNSPVRNTINTGIDYKVDWIVMQSPKNAHVNQKAVDQVVSEGGNCIRGWTNEDFEDTSSESDIF